MTVDELLSFLEGCHLDAEVQIAIPGAEPYAAMPIGIVTNRSLGLQPTEPGSIWLLAGERAGPIDAAIWDPSCRHRP